MERVIYTKREAQIIQTKRPIAITDEEFLALYHKAILRNKIEHINHLGDVYPNIESRVFSDEFIENQTILFDYLFRSSYMPV